MALKWPDKNPDLVEDFSVDWSRAFNTGEVISSVAWAIEADGVGRNVDSATPIVNLVPEYPTGITNTNTVATIRVGQGKVNKKYKFTCTVTTSSNRTLTEDIYLRVTEGA